MNYEQIRHNSPAGLRKKKPARPLNAVPVLLFFAVHMIWFLTGGGLVQVYLGMGGVVITELVMLVMSIGFLFLMHADFRDVFPVRKPRWSALGACIILWAGITLANMVVSMLLMYWFPGPYNTLSNEDAFFNQFPILLQILVIALLPAICEEAMHRGVMQSGLKKSIRNTPVLILVMGLLFAVFHLYPIKYPTMILLGCLMSYVLAVTGNMVYSSFLHFFNNLMSILLGSVTSGMPAMLFLQFITAASDYGGAASPDTGSIMQYVTRAAVGHSITLIGTPVPLLLYTGSYLLKLAEAPVRPSFIPHGKGHVLLNRLILPTLAFFFGGILLAAL